MEYIKESKQTPVAYTVDVVVVGAGPAGSMAAVAAARNGAKTLLLERYATLGGTFTNGLVSWVPVDKMGAMEVYGETKPVQGGLITELIERLYQEGGAYKVEDVLVDPPVAKFSIYNQTDPEIAKVVLQQMVLESGAEILVQTMVADVIMEEGRVAGVIIENKSGRQAVRAKLVIDASGDGDVAAFAGAEYQKHDKPMKMSLMAAFANVDTTKTGWPMDGAYNKRFHGLVEQAIANGDLPEKGGGGDGVFQELSDSVGAGGLSPMWYLKNGSYPENWWRRNEALGIISSCNADATDAAQLTQAELSTRASVLPVINFFRKYVPGYERAYVAYTAGGIGIRESRRVVGDYILTLDVKDPADLRQPDVITKCKTAGFEIETYTPETAPVFDIPYRCLYPVKVDGLLTAGRCISIDHEVAMKLTPRDVGTCLCIGQAAGTAAALCVKEGIQPRALDYKKLQAVLEEQGVNVDYEG